MLGKMDGEGERWTVVKEKGRWMVGFVTFCRPLNLALLIVRFSMKDRYAVRCS